MFSCPGISPYTIPGLYHSWPALNPSTLHTILLYIRRGREAKKKRFIHSFNLLKRFQLNFLATLGAPFALMRMPVHSA